MSRVLGFIRDLLVARLFGASPLADAYFVAFRIPNLLRSFVAEGALNSAFVPVFVGKMKEGTLQRNDAFRSALGFVCVLAGGLTVLGMLFAPQIIALMAPGFADVGNKQELTIALTRIMFPLLLCVSLVAAIGGALNALKIFGAPAAAQISMNLALIGGALLAAHSPDPIFVLAWSVLVGGIAQIVTQVPALRKAKLPLLPTMAWRGDVIKPICRLLLPATLGAAVYQGTIFLATVFASWLGNGAISWLFYADRLTQLPIGIFSIALASVLLPLLAKARVDGDSDGFNAQLTRSLRWTSFLLIPMSVWLWIDAEALVRILFQRGSFSARDTIMTAAAVKGLTLGLWAMSCQSMITRAFIASHDTKTPSLLGILSLSTYVFSALVFTLELRDAVFGAGSLVSTIGLPSFGHVGLAFSSSVAALTSFLVAMAVALRRFPRLGLGVFVRSVFVCFVASMIGSVAFFVVSGDLVNLLQPWLVQVISIAGFGTAYLCGLFILQSAELSELISAIRR